VLIEIKAYTSLSKSKRRIVQKWNWSNWSSVRIIEGAGADEGEGGPSVPGTDEGGPRRDARVST